MDNIDNLFGFEDDLAYLNNAALGLMPITTRDMILEIATGLSSKGLGGFDFMGLFDEWSKLQANLANLINGKPEGISLTTNTASALHIAADGLFSNYKRGKNIVIPDIEFSSNSYMWQNLAQRHGMELRTVAYSRGETGYNAWKTKIDENTVLVSVSSVQFSNGFKSDVKLISDLIHSHDGFLIVDAIQHIGGIPFDVQEYNADFVAAGAYKWQLGPTGSGFFYINPTIIEDHKSILVGWFSSDSIFNMSHNSFVPGKGARRYQQSYFPNYNAYNASIELLIKQDPKRIHLHIKNLIDYLVSNLPESYTVDSDLNNDKRSNILRLITEAPQDKVDLLQKNNVYVGSIEGGIRVSPHIYNTKADIDKLLEILIN